MCRPAASPPRRTRNRAVRRAHRTIWRRPCRRARSATIRRLMAFPSRTSRAAARRSMAQSAPARPRARGLRHRSMSGFGRALPPSGSAKISPRATGMLLSQFSAREAKQFPPPVRPGAPDAATIAHGHTTGVAAHWGKKLAKSHDNRPRDRLGGQFRSAQYRFSNTDS